MRIIVNEALSRNPFADHPGVHGETYQTVMELCRLVRVDFTITPWVRLCQRPVPVLCQIRALSSNPE